MDHIPSNGGTGYGVLDVPDDILKLILMKNAPRLGLCSRYLLALLQNIDIWYFIDNYHYFYCGSCDKISQKLNCSHMADIQIMYNTLELWSLRYNKHDYYPMERFYLEKYD